MSDELQPVVVNLNVNNEEAMKITEKVYNMKMKKDDLSDLSIDDFLNTDA